MPIDYLAALRTESDRFAAVLADVDLSAPVPSCPDWCAADLIWHLTEVQHFWGSIVSDLLDDPDDVAALARPDDGALLATFADRADRLVAALTDRAADAACWSWHADGHRVGWVRRRQAHEALIHRVDAELAAGREPTATDSELAADGVDEILRGMIGGVPDWGAFDRTGESLVLEATDTGDAWTLQFGRFTGTSPNTGTTYDEPALEVAAEPEPEPATRLAGPAWQLDLWLWGRAPADPIAIAGDPELRDRLRRLAAEDTA